MVTVQPRAFERPALRFLAFRPEHVDLIVAGVKTQTARGKVEAGMHAGTIIRCWKAGRPIVDIEITSVTPKRLGDFDAADCQREGGYTPDAFRTVWRKLHRGHYHPATMVQVIRFRVVQVLGEGENTNSQAPSRGHGGGHS
jgi:hypothetical protein